MMPNMSLEAEALAKTKRVLVMYHRADMDGRFSSGIAYRKFGDSAFYLGMNYEDITQVEITDFAPNVESIYLLDYCLPVNCIHDLLSKGIRVIVLDHHHSALVALTQYHAKYITDEKESNRLFQAYEDSPDIAGCEVAWAYFYPTIPAPFAVKLTGIYDTWKAHHPLWEEALNFNSGLYLEEDTSPQAELWQALIEDGIGNPLVNSYISKGQIAELTRTRHFTSDALAWRGILEWEGYVFLALNASGNSKVAEPGFDPEVHDAILLYRWSPRIKKWKISLYQCPTVKSTGPEMDLSKIAVKYGGGGHKGACGFACEELPFKLSDIR